MEKATELGVSEVFPTQSEFTNSERINQDRLQAHAIEAAAQCGGTYVPKVHTICKLIDTLEKWPKDRNIFFCNEDNLKPKKRYQTYQKEPGQYLSAPKAVFQKAKKISF